MADDPKIRTLPSTGDVPEVASRQVPPGKVEMVITYLEMTAPPAPRGASHRAEPVAIVRARRPTLSFYRYLYNTVGGPWMWYERRDMDDDTLAGIVQDPRVHVYVMQIDGVPAGFVELDMREPEDIEIAYFGLVPEFIGRGLGRYLLEWTIATAFEREPRRLWVHTCNLDHPGALANYQRCGFEPYRQERKLIDDPRL